MNWFIIYLRVIGVATGFSVSFGFFLLRAIRQEVFEPKASFIPGFIIALITLLLIKYRTDKKFVKNGV